MSYTSSTNAYTGFSFSNSTGAINPGVSNIKENFLPIIPREPFIYLPDMPLSFEQHIKIISNPAIANDFWQENFNFYINDALKRYKEINNDISFDTVTINDFLTVLKDVCNTLHLQPYIIFNKFATKVQLIYDNKDFVLDYDHEDSDTVFILSSISGILTVKESSLDKLEETLRSF